MNPLLTLLQINDSVFPIGGFTHSYGLETYIDKRIVKDSATAEAYATSMLRYSFYYNDAAFFWETWKICEKRATKDKLLALDRFITTLKSPSEIRDASKKLAIRFLKVVENLKSVRRCKSYLESIQSGRAHGHYAMAFAMYAHSQHISFEDALSAFYYNSLNGMVTNCAKLVPISQMDGQKILFKLQPLIRELVAKQKELAEDMIGNCCVAQDIRCMQHEKLYTRIYIS
ncbi:urease accessory protein UreF [Sphingobacterium psychroaquaticum]|uniref:urease accessory protein UreF n=1 Tax=Sphingobacterium psychroaquaticum TaxID=561061 RepID=UPI00106B016A|nr:urease accessory protein UreF [Sphingobacterium psychroaquaticum]QBQ42664.1 urease accessory protein UreF [Sphingobacterium psychroaquaticum]